MSRRESSLVKQEGDQDPNEQPSAKRFKADCERLSLTFEVGRDLRKASNRGHNADTLAVQEYLEQYDYMNLPQRIPEFKHRLVFDSWQLRGKLADVEDGQVIQIPQLYPETVARFLDLLSSKEGQDSCFRKLDNLVLAFIFATAIEDPFFVSLIAGRIYNFICQVYEEHETGRSEIVHQNILELLHWAWAGSSKARVSLRPLLTMSHAWLSTAGAQKKTTKKAMVKPIFNGPKLSLDSLEKLEATNPDWDNGLIQDYVRKCIRLNQYNREKKKPRWEMVPLTELLTDDCLVEIAHD